MKIIICMAQTADGKIAKTKDQLANWTSKDDKKHFIELTKKHKVLIMGETTFNTIGRPLPGRLNFILAKDPEKYKDKIQKGLLEFFSGSPEKIVDHLSKRGFESAILGGGAFTNANFLKSNLVDEIYLTNEGLLFGQGFGFCEGLNRDIRLKTIDINKLSDHTFVVHYEVEK